MQREERVERWGPARRAPGQLLRGDAERRGGDAKPFGAALVVAEHAVHHRYGVGRASQVRGGWPSRPFPADAEALPAANDVVEVAGDRVDLQAPAECDMVLAAEERQSGHGVGAFAGSDQVTSSEVDVGRHDVDVEKFEAIARNDRERANQLRTATHDPDCLRNVVEGDVDGRQPVEGGALEGGVASPVGEIDGVPRRFDDGRSPLRSS